MNRKPILKFFSFLTVLLYSATSVMAGQVITDNERSWAKKVVDGTADIDPFDSTNSIAVLNYRNLTGIKRFNVLQKGLAIMLIEDLAKIDSLLVIDRNKMQALQDEIARQAKEPVDPATLITKTGQKLQAGHVISGDIQEGAFDQLAIGTDFSATPFDNSSQLPFVSGNIDDLIQLEKEILLNILEKLEVHISDHQKNEIMTPLSASTSALMALFMATDYADRGQYAEATGLFSEALAQDAGLGPARNALTEMQEKGLTENVELPPVPTAAPEPVSIAAPIPPATAPAEKSEGLSTGMKVGIGVGVAALVGVALAGGGGGGGGSDDSSDTADTSSDSGDTQTADQPIASIDKTSTDCSGDTVTFRFTEKMNTSAGTINVSPDFEVSQGWENDTTYQVVWSLTDYCDSAPSAISMTLDGFKSAAGQSLGGQSVFQLEFRSGNSI